MSRAKEAAGRAAAERVEEGMLLGLGTGSTVRYALLRLSERIRDEGLAVRGVPTSVETERLARDLSIPLCSLAEVERLDLTIDGADEIDPAFDMIKGGGGALLREKVVAWISEREIIAVGREKLVPRLGTTFRLPVEIAPFARPVVERAIRALGAEPELRRTPGGEASFVTDNGNHILDCRFPEGIPHAADLEAALDRIPGIVESGLFVGLAHAVAIGDEDGTSEVKERGR